MAGGQKIQTGDIIQRLRVLFEKIGIKLLQIYRCMQNVDIHPSVKAIWTTVLMHVEPGV